MLDIVIDSISVITTIAHFYVVFLSLLTTIAHFMYTGNLSSDSSFEFFDYLYIDHLSK